MTSQSRNESYLQKELEWDGGEAGMVEDVFYHPYLAPDRMENSVIDFDIQNLQALLKEKTNFPVEKIAKRVNEHYLDSSRLIKRAFGNKIEDDFQLYNWGLTLTMDMGLATDKLEFLLMIYAKKLPRRITRADFDYIIERHSTVRNMEDKHKRKLKWLDLVASFKIHTVRKPGFPDTIGKRQMITILDVNNVDLDLDVLRITKDLRKADEYANRLHVLLLDDPLINGTFREAMASGKLNFKHANGKERLRDFEARVRNEEEAFGPLVQQEVDERMRKEFEVKEAEEARRAAARKKREDARIEAKLREEEEKQAARDRLEQIKRERLEWERRKAEKAELDAAAERTRHEREKEEAERLRRQQEAEQAQRAHLASEAAAAAEAEARREMERLEEERLAAVGMFDHLSGEERLRAEAAYKLAEHRRIKAIERKRLLEETRIFAESQLARRPAAKNDVVAASSTPKKRRAIEEARLASSSSASGPLRPVVIQAESEEEAGEPNAAVMSLTERLLQPRKGKGTVPAISRARSPSPESERVRKEADERRVEELVRAELVEMSDEERKLAKAEEEWRRIEATRARLRREEDERIRQIEVEESRRQEQAAEAQRKRRADEALQHKKSEEAARAKLEREKRAAEAAVLRKLAEENREEHMRAEEERVREAVLARAGGKTSAQLALEAREKDTANRKAREDREAKQRAARDRARKVQEDAEAKRAALASVIEAKHAAAKGNRAKKGHVAKKDMPLLDADELWGGSNCAAGEGVFSSSLASSTGGGGLQGTEDSFLYVGDGDDDVVVVPGGVEATEKDVGEEDEQQAEDDVQLQQETADERALREAAEAEAALAQALAEAQSMAAAEAEAAALAAEEEAKAIEERRRQEEHAQAETQRQAKVREAEERMREMLEERERARAEAKAKADRLAQEDEARRAEEEAERERREQEAVAQRRLEEEEATRLAEQEAVAAQALLQSQAEAEARRTLEEEQERERVAKEAVAAAEARAKAEAEAEAERIRLELEAEEAAEEAVKAELEARAKELEEEERREREAAEMLARERAEISAVAEAAKELKRRQVEEARLEAERERRAQDEAQRAEEQARLVALEEKARLQREAEAAVLAAQEEVRRQQEEEARRAEEGIERQRLERMAAEAEAAALVEAEARAKVEAAELARVEREEAEADAKARSVLADPATPGKFERPAGSLALAEQRRVCRFEELDVDVLKSADGTLRINVRLDSDLGGEEGGGGAQPGLFIHGFKSNSAAALQGLVREGDELLAVEGAAVEGQTLEALVAVLRAPALRAKASLRLRVRRFQPPPPPSPTAHLDTLPPFLIQEVDDCEREAAPAGAVVGVHLGPGAPEHLEDLAVGSTPAVDIELEVPVSEDGRLRLYIRHDDEGDAHGLFLHGFKPDSAAERQGLLRVGDELLAVSGRSVKGRYLEDVVAALADHTGPTVAMTVRRHLVDDADELRREVEALELEAKRVALEAMLDEIERQQAAYGEVTEADRKEMQRRKQEQMERVMLEQKRQRQVKMAREAEERARRAANTPNSLMNKEIAAAWLLRNAPFEDLVIDVPKTQGELRIHVKHSKKRGLFVHGFKPNSLAQEQGELLEGDELLAVDGIDMRGKALPALVSALRYHDQNSVNIKVRRHKYKGVEL